MVITLCFLSIRSLKVEARFCNRIISLSKILDGLMSLICNCNPVVPISDLSSVDFQRNLLP